jgi:hypothetical protein
MGRRSKKITRSESSEVIIDNSKQATKSIMSGLNTPMINRIFNLNGGFLYKTSCGYYKQGQLNLFNCELYLYQEPDRDLDDGKQLDKKVMHMIILTPGVFLKTLKPIQLELNNRTSKIFPLELYVGGTISNIGVRPAEYS